MVFIFASVTQNPFVFDAFRNNKYGRLVSPTRAPKHHHFVFHRIRTSRTKRSTTPQSPKLGLELRPLRFGVSFSFFQISLWHGAQLSSSRLSKRVQFVLQGNQHRFFQSGAMLVNRRTHNPAWFPQELRSASEVSPNQGRNNQRQK